MIPAFADDLFVTWDDDSGVGYAAAFEYPVPADGDYHLMVISTPARQTSGDFRLLVVIDAPGVLSGEAQPNGDTIAILDRDATAAGVPVEERTGTLTADETSTFYTLTWINACDTLYVFTEATSDNLKPIILLQDFGDKPLSTANVLGQETPATLQYTFDDDTINSTLSISGLAFLTDGEYREPVAPDSATETVVEITEHMVFGELAGEPAAAVVLVTDPGGSANFYDLAVLLERSGQPFNVASTLLGDRVQINSLSPEDGQIVVDMITEGPADPMCCPAQQVVQTCELRGTDLVQTSEEVLSAACGSEIVGVVWKWVKFLGGDGTTISVDDPGKYTLELMPDGQLRIQEGFNSASGTYTLGGSAGLTLELDATTLGEWKPRSLCDQYLEMLGWARTCVFEGDQLVLDTMADAGDLCFERIWPVA